MTKKTEKYILRAGYSIVGMLFLYWILLMIFGQKMPFSEVYYHINENYDYYAEKVLYSLPIVIISIVFILSLRPTSKKKFLRLQASLPTSKINAVAMSLV